MTCKGAGEEYKMRKALAAGIILLFFGTSVVSGFTTNLTNNPQPMDRGWLYVGGSGLGNYTKIQDAINDAVDGDTVFAYDDSSPYYENVLVNKAIYLIGESRNTTIIDGHSESVMEIIESRVFISSFTLRDASANGQAGIKLNNINNVTIVNCIITHNSYGISSSNSNWINDLSIMNCVINDNSVDGIYLEPFSDGSSENYFVPNKAIKNINSNFNGWRSNAMISNISIKDCSINRNTNGIQIGGARDIEVHHNFISNNDFQGIFLWANTYEISIDNNTISDNGAGGWFACGIMVQDCKNCYIKNNNIFSNDIYGILFFDSPENRIIENTFKENRINAFFYHNNNFWYGNYWNESRLLPKLIFGRIGIFDLHFLLGNFIPWINIDWHPAQQPYDFHDTVI